MHIDETSIHRPAGASQLYRAEIAEKLHSFHRPWLASAGSDLVDRPVVADDGVECKVERLREAAA